ncbi:MAG: hypothetical protein DCC71_00465 [Proteobacteria bacterium]|nr:MAG: hypothetical protein DCC71_00465 [Pseudomonadota bacterium]
MRRPPFVLLVCALLLPTAARATVYTVTTTADAGAGSLREALAAADAGDVIEFAIPGEGVQQIAPQSALPAVAAGVTIDATTQPGASCEAWPPTLRVELSGAQAPATTDGLVVAGDGVVIVGLAISGWPRNGVLVDGVSETVIECNFVGTDAAGAQAQSNGADGIRIVGTGVNNLVRANLLSGNTIDGIRIQDADRTAVWGNRIGTDATGAQPLPNGGAGVELLGSASLSSIGSPTEPNRIEANGGGGIVVSGAGAFGNDLLYNSLAKNGSVGIDLVGALLEDPNDPGDADAGPNRLQNTPVVSSAAYDEGAGTLTVTYLVDTQLANAAYPLLVAVYGADLDQEEGEVLLGTVTYTATDFAAGSVAKSFVPQAAVAIGQWLVAAARDDLGNTSEYSEAIAVPEPGALACGALALAALRARRRR